MKICQASELSQKHAKTLCERTMEDAQVDTVSERTPKQRTLNHTQQKDMEKFLCQRCGSQHGPRQCPAFGKVCKQMERKKITMQSNACPRVKERGVHAVEETALEDAFFVGMVEEKKAEWRLARVHGS